MGHDEARLRDIFERAVPDDAEPLYCVVAGSRLHGVAGPDSDVDLRAVHVVDAERYALLDRPAERVAVNQDGVAEGFADVPDVEVVSHELRRFGTLVAEGNFNALEVLFADDPLVAAPDAMDPLRATVEDHLPLDVPRGYVGMARSNYGGGFDADGGDQTRRPTARRSLRVLRGLLAAKYVLAEERVEPDVVALADHGLEDPGLVDELIAVRRGGVDGRPDPDLASRADAAIRDLLAELDPLEGVDEGLLRAAVDEWMLDVRGALGESAP